MGTKRKNQRPSGETVRLNEATRAMDKAKGQREPVRVIHPERKTRERHVFEGEHSMEMDW